jgi:hypothetical protein
LELESIIRWDLVLGIKLWYILLEVLNYVAKVGNISWWIQAMLIPSTPSHQNQEATRSNGKIRAPDLIGEEKGSQVSGFWVLKSKCHFSIWVDTRISNIEIHRGSFPLLRLICESCLLNDIAHLTLWGYASKSVRSVLKSLC